MTPKWQLFYYFLLVPVPKFPGRKGEGKIIGSFPPFPNHRGDKDTQKIIQADIPPGHLVDLEQNKRADLHRHKERQDKKKKRNFFQAVGCRRLFIMRFTTVLSFRC
jgi:hypothetical protein